MDIRETGNILVPYDFSEFADNALDFASHFAKIFDKKVSLLHVLESKGFFSGTSTAEEIAIKDKLVEIAAANAAKTGIATEALLKPGNIFDQIGEIASENNCTLIVMGTHGIKGMQALTGSRAMKVITKSKTPFVVVQKKIWNSEGMKNIVVPINEEPESKQKLEWAQFFAKIFKSTLHVIAHEKSDEFINNKVNNNLAWAKNTLKHNGVSCNIINVPVSEDFYKYTISESVAIGADMIVVNTDPKTNLADYVMGPYEQKVIANEAQIPVMCINTKEVYSILGNVFSFLS